MKNMTEQDHEMQEGALVALIVIVLAVVIVSLLLWIGIREERPYGMGVVGVCCRGVVINRREP